MEEKQVFGAVAGQLMGHPLPASEIQVLILSYQASFC